MSGRSRSGRQTSSGQYYDEQLQQWLPNCCQFDPTTGARTCTRAPETPSRSRHSGSSSRQPGYGSRQSQQYQPQPPTPSYQQGGQYQQSHQYQPQGYPAHQDSRGGWGSLIAQGQQQPQQSHSSGGDVWRSLMAPGSENGPSTGSECLYGIHDDPCRCYRFDSGLAPPPPKGAGRKDYSRDRAHLALTGHVPGPNGPVYVGIGATGSGSSGAGSSSSNNRGGWGDLL